MGAGQLMMIVLALTQSRGADGALAFDIESVFQVQNYLDRGGIFVVAPILAFALLAASLKIKAILSAAALRIRQAQRAAGQSIKINPQSYFPPFIMSLAFAEAIVLLAFLLSSESHQGAYIVPFGACSGVAWLRAYPSREDLRRFLFG